MDKSKNILKQLISGDMVFEEFIGMELQLAESVQKSCYSKPILHEETPLSILCMNLYQAIKAENPRHAWSFKISSIQQSPLCQYWFNRAQDALQNCS